MSKSNFITLILATFIITNIMFVHSAHAECTETDINGQTVNVMTCSYVKSNKSFPMNNISESDQEAFRSWLKKYTKKSTTHVSGSRLSTQTFSKVTTKMKLISSLVARYSLGFLRTTLIPHENFFYTSLALTCLSLIWLLSIAPIKKWMGRLWLPSMMIYLGITLLNTMANMWYHMSSSGKLVMITSILFATLMTLAVIVHTGMNLYQLLIRGIDSTPHIAHNIIGALFASMLINSKYISNPDTYFAPGALSGLIGLITAVVLGVMWNRETLPLQTKPMATPQPAPVPTPQPPAQAFHQHYIIAQTPQGPVAMANPQVQSPVDPYRTPVQPVMSCPTCSNLVPDGNFCIKCGNRLSQP